RLPRIPRAFRIAGVTAYEAPTDSGAVGVVCVPAETATYDVGVPPTSPWLRRLLVANLVLQVPTAVTGGLVRLTGSGLGCPTWPRCEGDSFAPVIHDAMTFHPFVEYGNRLLSVLVGVGALATVWAVFRWARHRTPMFGLALTIVGLTL